MRTPSSGAAWPPHRAHSLAHLHLECFHFPHTIAEITVSNYRLRSAVVVLMSSSFSSLLKAHRFLHTRVLRQAAWRLGPSLLIFQWRLCCLSGKVLRAVSEQMELRAGLCSTLLEIRGLCEALRFHPEPCGYLWPAPAAVFQCFLFRV